MRLLPLLLAVLLLGCAALSVRAHEGHSSSPDPVEPGQSAAMLDAPQPQPSANSDKNTVDKQQAQQKWGQRHGMAVPSSSAVSASSPPSSPVSVVDPVVSPRPLTPSPITPPMSEPMPNRDVAQPTDTAPPRSPRAGHVNIRLTAPLGAHLGSDASDSADESDDSGSDSSSGSSSRRHGPVVIVVNPNVKIDVPQGSVHVQPGQQQSGRQQSGQQQSGRQQQQQPAQPEAESDMEPQRPESAQQQEQQEQQFQQEHKQKQKQKQKPKQSREEQQQSRESESDMGQEAEGEQTERRRRRPSQGAMSLRQSAGHLARLHQQIGHLRAQLSSMQPKLARDSSLALPIARARRNLRRLNLQLAAAQARHLRMLERKLKQHEAKEGMGSKAGTGMGVGVGVGSSASGPTRMHGAEPAATAGPKLKATPAKEQEQMQQQPQQPQQSGGATHFDTQAGDRSQLLAIPTFARVAVAAPELSAPLVQPEQQQQQPQSLQSQLSLPVVSIAAAAAPQASIPLAIPTFARVQTPVISYAQPAALGVQLQPGQLQLRMPALSSVSALPQTAISVESSPVRLQSTITQQSPITQLSESESTAAVPLVSQAVGVPGPFEFRGPVAPLAPIDPAHPPPPIVQMPVAAPLRTTIAPPDADAQTIAQLAISSGATAQTAPIAYAYPVAVEQAQPQQYQPQQYPQQQLAQQAPVAQQPWQTQIAQIAQLQQPFAAVSGQQWAVGQQEAIAQPQQSAVYESAAPVQQQQWSLTQPAEQAQAQWSQSQPAFGSAVGQQSQQMALQLAQQQQQQHGQK